MEKTIKLINTLIENEGLKEDNFLREFGTLVTVSTLNEKWLHIDIKDIAVERKT